VLLGNPVDHAFDFAAFGVFAQGVGVVAAPQFGDVAVGILDDFVALDNVRTAQTDFAACYQTLEFRRWDFGKIIPFDQYDFGKRHDAFAQLRFLRMIADFQLFRLVFRIIVDNHAQRL